MTNAHEQLWAKTGRRSPEDVAEIPRPEIPRPPEDGKRREHLARPRADWPERSISAAEHMDLTVGRYSEAEFQDWVIREAVACGWPKATIYHTKDSRFSPAGFPDLVLVHGRRRLWWELKGPKGYVEPEQQIWLDALEASGEETAVLYPWHWAYVRQELERGPVPRLGRGQMCVRLLDTEGVPRLYRVIEEIGGGE